MARYSTLFTLEVSHHGLNKYRKIKGHDQFEVEQKASRLKAQWDAEWLGRVAIADRRQSHFSSKALAEEFTAEAEMQLMNMRNIILDGYNSSIEFNWKKLEKNEEYERKKPIKPILEQDPEIPINDHIDIIPEFGFLELIFPKLKARATALAEAKNAEQKMAFDKKLAQWEDEVQKIRSSNLSKMKKYESLLIYWNNQNEKHIEAQRKHNEEIRDYEQSLKALSKSGDEESIKNLIKIALNTVKKPDFFTLDYDLEYKIETNSCVIDFIIPSIDDFPTLKEVKYVQSSSEFVEKHISKIEKDRLYDSCIYQLTILVIHTIFRAEPNRHLKRVTFNGWVDHVVASTGMDERTCIMSIGVNRDDMDKIDVARVDPKECFRALKGVAASKLVGLAPVAPLERPRHADKRFVESQEVASTLDEGVNLAAMDWQEFEHLVRQIFEHEYSSPGSEVRVTQASRDGGVDAIVHDPDPIKGGKIVIQAKRYTNTVDVAAVRDLYGTVHNEGAIKGILITTSQFGPDARKFAQGKPITLLDGSNLLFLLEKMGTKARIDLREAKKLLGEKEQANLRR